MNDFDPQLAGLAAGASVLGRLSGPSRTPVGLGSILGQLGGAMYGAKQNALAQRDRSDSDRMLREAQVENLKAQAEARKAAEAEKAAKAQKLSAFSSILGQSESPNDPITILGAGIKSQAFGPQEITSFMGNVMQKQAALEAKVETEKVRLEDRKISREEREASERRLREFSAKLQQDNMRLAAALRPQPEGAKPPTGYRYKSDQPGVLEPIPGGPATVLTPEQAGKGAMTRQAILDVERAEKVMFDKNGKLRMSVVLKSKAPFGGFGEDARLANSYIRNAVSAKYRLETGAAGNQAEVDDIMARFMPSPLDNTTTAKDKMSRLKEFMNMSLRDMKAAGIVKAGDAPAGGDAAPWED